MKTVYKSTKSNTHQYCFNQFGQSVHIDNAVKNQMEKYYYDQNQMIEMILRDGQKNVKHFALKSKGEFTYNGKTYKYDSQNESPEHYNFKVQIYHQRYFNWKGYKIHIDFPQTEIVADGSMYRFDLKAKLLDGTDIGIEIVNTSNLSESKRKYLQQKQLLTFIIFLDKDGNQELEQFDIVGNGHLEELQERILKGKRECELLYKEKRRVYFNPEKHGEEFSKEYQQRISRYKNSLGIKISQLREKANSIEEQYNRESAKRGYINESKVRDISIEIGKVIDKIREYKNRLSSSKNATGKSIRRHNDETSKVIKVIRSIKQEIEEHERFLTFYNDFNYTGEIKLNQCTKIIDVKKFAESHLEIYQKNKHNLRFKPYYDRLIQLQKLLKP